MTIEAMKQALEALEGFIPYLPLPDKTQCGRYDKAITALRAAIEQAQPELEQAMTDAIIGGTGVMLGDKRIDPASIYKQPEQEPVAWYDSKTGWTDFHAFKPVRQPSAPDAEWLPLYTTPPPRREWQGLTKDELLELWESNTEQPFPEWFVDFKRAYEVIEAKLKEKNK